MILTYWQFIDENMSKFLLTPRRLPRFRRDRKMPFLAIQFRSDDDNRVQPERKFANPAAVSRPFLTVLLVYMQIKTWIYCWHFMLDIYYCNTIFKSWISRSTTVTMNQFIFKFISTTCIIKKRLNVKQFNFPKSQTVDVFTSKISKQNMPLKFQCQ